jgi:hypothetical protein
MRGKAIDELWEAWHIDRQVREALERALQDDRFVNLVRQHLPNVGTADVRRSLRRANIRIDYPQLFRGLTPPAVVAAATALVADEPALRAASTPSVSDAAEAAKPNTEEAEAARAQLQRTTDLFALGRIRAGDVLTIKGRDESQATVVDGSTVEYRGSRMSFLAWGKAVTGWKAIQIYAWAQLPDGRLLGDLRD